MSAPLPPLIISSPVPPEIVSAASPPVMVSLAFEPVIVSFPLVPVIVTPADALLASTKILSVPTANEFSKVRFAKLMVV